MRDYCKLHDIAYREANQRSIVIPAPKPAALESLLERFEGETFGARAGALLAPGAAGDSALEAELARRGVDAYRAAFPNYFFCAVCAFEDGSLVLLSEKLWASEVIRRVRPAIKGLDVEVQPAQLDSVLPRCTGPQPWYIRTIPPTTSSSTLDWTARRYAPCKVN